MEKNLKKMDTKKKLLLINDIAILLVNIVLCIITFYLSYKEKSYRGSSKLFILQIVLNIIIIILDIILNFKNLLNNYKGHNKYGMLIRYIMFYMIIFCVMLTYQRSHNLDHDDIIKAGNIAFYIGFANNGLIISSMVLSFLVIDIQNEEKILVNRNRRSINMGSVENMKLLENSNISNQIFTEMEKKDEE